MDVYQEENRGGVPCSGNSETWWGRCDGNGGVCVRFYLPIIHVSDSCCHQDQGTKGTEEVIIRPVNLDWEEKANKYIRAGTTLHH